MQIRSKVKLLALVPVVLAAGACTTKNDIDLNTDYQWSKSEAETARMQAIAEIAKQGEGGVVAAALLMQQGGTYDAQPPRTTSDRVVDVIKTALPALGSTLVGVGQIGATVYAADVQKDIAMNNSNNNATVTMHTNDTMATIAEATIVDPVVVETTTTTTTSNTTTTTTNN